MSEENKKFSESVRGEAEENTPATSHFNPVEAEIASLRQQLEAKDLEAKNNYERLLRQAAELENFKKRSTREREDGIRFANEGLVKDLLPVVDNLERAVAHASGGGNGKPLVEGVEMVLRGLLDVLTKHGVSLISAQGQPFDPTKHEAMSQVESDEHEPNSVVEELHKGYMLRDRLLRAALVSVAKPSKTREKKTRITRLKTGKAMIK